jgi:5'/3'-nucleotidase SurE
VGVSFILVTNDDGYSSPSLVPLIRALSPLGRVRAVVPDRERSWIAKAITRWEDVRVERADRDGCEIWRTSGCPADCTQLGVHTLFGDAPKLVVSGINLGFNHGLAFFMSSGTVGGATEGWIAGLPAIALSTGVIENHDAWAEHARKPEAERDWMRAAELSAQICTVLLGRGMPSGADLLNVNFNFGAGPETRREITELGRVGYDRVFFERAPGVYFHEFGGMVRRSEASLKRADVVAAKRGVVSITPVQLPHSVALADEDRSALEA